MMVLPQTEPVNDPGTLWALQKELLEMAQRLLGIRDESKTIYQPQFTDEGPQIRNTPDRDGAFTELGRKCESDWEYVVYQMAHETIHLLNPVLLGQANNLEEGVAVAFSIKVQPLYSIEFHPKMLPSYVHALRLVSKLPRDLFEAAKRVRDHAGSLSSVTVQQLEELFPSVDRATLSELAERFVRDAGCGDV